MTEGHRQAIEYLGHRGAYALRELVEYVLTVAELAEQRGTAAGTELANEMRGKCRTARQIADELSREAERLKEWASEEG